jgi:hypothetical protein
MSGFFFPCSMSMVKVKFLLVELSFAIISLFAASVLFMAESCFESSPFAPPVASALIPVAPLIDAIACFAFSSMAFSSPSSSTPPVAPVAPTASSVAPVALVPVAPLAAVAAGDAVSSSSSSLSPMSSSLTTEVRGFCSVVVVAAAVAGVFPDLALASRVMIPSMFAMVDWIFEFSLATNASWCASFFPCF